MEKGKNLVELQQQAFEIACKNLGINSHTVILSTKHDIRTGADQALYSQWYKDMVIKRTCMGCQSLDIFNKISAILSVSITSSSFFDFFRCI